jgi:hypothetical protein
MHRCLLALVLVLLPTLGACGDTPRENAAPEPAEGDCGGYVVTNSDEDGPPDRSAKQQCLLDAFAGGDSAHLDVQLTTVEGDPIYYRYTVVGRRVVEVRTDTTEDKFGIPAVTTERCESLIAVDASMITDRCAPVS